MSTIGKIEIAGRSSIDSAEVCQTVVLAEDSTAHVSAMELCDRLQKQLGNELQFNFHTCRFKELSDPIRARMTAEAVARADILLISTHGSDLSAPVQQWLELCFGLRQDSEGALALLLVEPIDASAAIGELIGRLQKASSRLRMDFLPLVPQSVEQLIRALPGQQPQSISPALKATHPHRPSDHWGINE
jgi:hypothetical protein